MKLGMLFGLMMFAFLDVVAAQYRHAYGLEPKDLGRVPPAPAGHPTPWSMSY